MEETMEKTNKVNMLVLVCPLMQLSCSHKTSQGVTNVRLCVGLNQMLSSLDMSECRSFKRLPASTAVRCFSDVTVRTQNASIKSASPSTHYSFHLPPYIQ